MVLVAEWMIDSEEDYKHQFDYEIRGCHSRFRRTKSNWQQGNFTLKQANLVNDFF